MSSRYNCIIIDDEYFARELIVDYLKEFPEFIVVGQYKNSLLAKQVLDQDIPIDLIFLDIQMPNETGIEFLKKNKLNSKIIFTTAFSEYAVESYNFDVIDYLLKPITEERFNNAIARFKKAFDIEKKVLNFKEQDDNRSRYFKIKSGAYEYKVYYNELKYLCSEGEYVRYVTSEKNYLVLGSLKKISEQLPDSFIQVHRSYIIAKSEIKGREKYTLLLNDLTKVPIGKTYRQEVLQRLKEFL